MGTMNRVFTALLTGTLLAVCTALLLCTGCGGGGNRGVELVATSADRSDSITINAGDLPVPAGVDAEVWARIVAEFAALEPGHTTCAPPLNAANRVDDLVLVTEGEGAPYLTWSYRNLGDYDLNGLVNASDLTPVGVHYGQTTASADWATAQVADGNGDGEVGLGDITPIGQNYLNQVKGYLVETSVDGTAGSDWSEVARVSSDDLVLEAGQSRPHLRLAVDSVPAGHYVRVTPFCYDAGGTQTEAGIAGTAVLPALNRRGDWWMEGRDNHHTSCSSLTGPRTCYLWWSVEVGGEGQSGPVLDNAGRIYVGGGDGLYIVEPDGSSFWCYMTSEPVETTPALAPDGTVYFGCNDGRFYALGPDRVLRWSLKVTSPLDRSPAIADDGTVWFVDTHGAVYAVAPDGTIIDSLAGSTSISGSSAIDGSGRVYFSGYQNSLMYYPESGGLMADLGFQLPVISYLPVYRDIDDSGTKGYEFRETLLTNGTAGVNAIEVDYFAGAEQYETVSFPGDYLVASLPPLAAPGGVVYLYDQDYHLMRFSVPEDESNAAGLDWRSPQPLVADMSGTTLDAEGCLYITRGNAYPGVIALNADGSSRWEYWTRSGVQPVIAPGNILLVVTTGGDLLAIGGPRNDEIPAAVEDLEVICDPFQSDYIDLKWPMATGASTYEVYRNGGAEPAVVITAFEYALGNSIYYTDEGLEPGTVYSYRVRAVNPAGAGEWSPEGQARTFLDYPLDFSASHGDFPDRIELTWQPITGATGYRIYRDTYYTTEDPVAVLGQELSWADYSIQDWNTHSYYLVAFNADTQSGGGHSYGAITRGVGDTSCGNWRMFGGDSGKRRAAAVPGPGAPVVAWQRTLNEPYTASIDELVGEPVFGGAGAVYLAGKRGYRSLVALNPDGSLRCSTDGEAVCPVVLDDGSIATGRNNGLVILNPNLSSSASLDMLAPSSLVLSPDGNLIGVEDRWLYSGTRTGEVVWEYYFPQTPVPSSLVADDIGNVYIAEYDNAPHNWGSTPVDYPERIYAFSPAGTLLWMTGELQYDWDMALGGAGRLYACFDGALNALDTVDGSVVWSYPLTGDLAVNAAEQVILAGESELVMLDPEGSLVWSYSPPAGFVCSYPIVDSAGSVYFNEFYTDGTDLTGNINRLVSLDAGGGYRWDYTQTGCSDHAAKSIRDDGYLFWVAEVVDAEGGHPVLLAFAP